MTNSALDDFIAAMQAGWGPISTELVADCRRQMDALTEAAETEDWLARLLAERPATRELHREPANGFMLLAHSERTGLYRPPHDHGRAWVVYGVQSGTLEVGTYARVADSRGDMLVRRGTTLLRPGEAQAYLPGDIHDTRCLSESALVFRFTERDLRHEDQAERKLTRFIAREGEWFAPPPQLR